MAVQSIVNPSGEIGGISSPKQMYTFFLLKLCDRYFEVMQSYDSESPKSKVNPDSATAALVAFCPNRKKREYLWKYYNQEKSNVGIMTASVLTIGELVQYLSETLEFEEQSVGGLM